MAERLNAPVSKTGAIAGGSAGQLASERELTEGDGNGPSSVLAPCLAQVVESSADLRVLIRAWPSLPGAVKAGMTAMVEAARHAGGQEGMR